MIFPLFFVLYRVLLQKNKHPQTLKAQLCKGLYIHSSHIWPHIINILAAFFVFLVSVPV